MVVCSVRISHPRNRWLSIVNGYTITGYIGRRDLVVVQHYRDCQTEGRNLTRYAYRSHNSSLSLLLIDVGFHILHENYRFYKDVSLFDARK